MVNNTTRGKFLNQILTSKTMCCWVGMEGKVNTLIRWDWNASDFYHKLNFFSVHFSLCQPHLLCVINMRSFSPHSLYPENCHYLFNKCLLNMFIPKHLKNWKNCQLKFIVTFVTFCRTNSDNVYNFHCLEGCYLLFVLLQKREKLYHHLVVLLRNQKKCDMEGHNPISFLIRA